MTALLPPRFYLCARCVRATRRFGRTARLGGTATASARRYSHAPTRQTDSDIEQHGRALPEQPWQPAAEEGRPNDQEEGALTRRLRSMSEEALETGGHGALKAVEEAGFSAELKAQLEQRIAAASLRSSEADLPASASSHTRDLATADVWTGTESIHDASLRMLNDAHKPLRLGRPPKMPGVPPPKTIDTGHTRSKERRGVRLANARDRSVVYATLKDDADLEATDRERRLQELKDRFEPNARAVVPGTIQGLASLANKRIEDAIARGQFKNIPRGKGANVERDYNASSPFIDTTEYFMNKIIQRQEIVPPWIEKQQELTSAASKFRSRLRADWKRHAARIIASKGGSLQDQVRRAEQFAQAELLCNPSRRKQETLTTTDKEGHMSQISISGGLKMVQSSEGSVVTEEITATRTPLQASPQGSAETSASPAIAKSSIETIQIPLSAPTPATTPAPSPFRDTDWERIEAGYHAVAIKDLNDKARSYNLQAPELAKRPYFNLQRELNSCYADVAPQLAQAIVDRTRRASTTSATPGQSSSGNRVLDGLLGGPVRVRDERREKQYGFKQFWKDLWSDKSASP